HDDERRPVARALKRTEPPGDHFQVVGVAHASDVPPLSDEPGRDVITEGESGVSLDRNAVVVVDPAEVRKLEMPGQRGRLGGDALRHAAVARKGIDVKVDEVVKPGPMIVGRLPTASEGHADAVGQSLAERARGRLHTTCPAVLRVTWTTAVEL